MIALLLVQVLAGDPVRSTARDSVRAQAPDTATRVTFGAFVDAYYAWDMGRPRTGDRAFAGGALFTTQPARHNEFNVNLAFVDATLAADRIRGRIAVQLGTSVVSNYSGEPTNGRVSGAASAQYIQEAFAGWQAARTLWIDGGIFLSHIGMEGWISRDNPTYTRSLVAEYSPYYQSGLRATWSPSARLTAQIDIVNGWQNISENNSGKGAGIRIDYNVSPSLTTSYYNLFSDESGSRLRALHGIGARATVGVLSILGELDAGSQKNALNDGGQSAWYGATLVARAHVTQRVALSGRVERFDDRNQIVAATGVNDSGDPNAALRANAASVGVDVIPAPRLMWRSELRAFRNGDGIFPNGESLAPRRTGGFAVSALTITF